MTISSRVQQQFFATSDSTAAPDAIIRLPLTLLDQIDYWSIAAKAAVSFGVPHRNEVKHNTPQRRSNLWTAPEHDRFLRGLELFPRGPWKRIAAVVRTKTTRQTMTHAQKYRQKIERHMRLTKTFAAAVAAPPVCARTLPFRSTDDSVFTAAVTTTTSCELASFMGNTAWDPVLSALIDSLEPIDNPDAWIMPVRPTQ